MTDEEVKQSRAIAVSMIHVMRAIGINAPEEISLPHRILRLCSEVERLDRARCDFEDRLAKIQTDSNRALENYRANERELERWRHGQTIEGDFVCPDSVALEAAKVALEAAKVALYDAMHAGNLSREYHDSVIEKIEGALK